MKQADLPSNLTLKGETHQGIPEIMDRFRARVKIASVDACSDEIIDQRGTKHLPLLLCDTTE